MKNVKIELTPYNAMSILAFLREFINEDNNDDPKFKAIHDAVDQYGSQITKNISMDQLDDYNAENQVNQLIGKSPKAKNNGV